PTLYSLYFFLFMIHLPPTSTLFPHDALPISAASAALPAVLARQLDRPHVGGALLDHRGADPALAPGAAALPVPRALAHLPLVPHAAPDRGQDGAQGRDGHRAPRRSRQARRARCAHRRAALI